MASTEVGSLHYDLNIDDKGLKSQLTNAEGHVKSFGDKLGQHWDKSVDASKKVLAGVTAAAAGIVGFGVVSVQAYMDAEKHVAALENTLISTKNASGQTIDGLKKMSSQLQATTGFTDEFVQEAQNMLLTFTKVGKDVFPEATRAALDMARQFGGDAQQNAIRLGKALQDPIAGVGALSKIGVQFSEVQKQQIQNFMDAGDIMSAQKVILGEITTQTKGAADAYGRTFAGQIDILKASFNDLQEGLGEFLVAGLKPLTRIFADWIADVNAAGGFLEYFKGIIDRNKDSLIIIAGAILGTLVPAIVSMGLAFGGFLLTIAPWAALGAGTVLLFQHLGITLDDVKNFIDKLVVSIGIFWNEYLIPMGNAIYEVALKVWNYLHPSLEALWNTITQRLIPAISGFWHDFIEPLIPVIGTALVVAIRAAIDVANALLTAVSAVINWLRENEWVLWQIVAVFTAIKVAMFLNGALEAFKGVIAGAISTYKGLQTLIATPLVMPAIVVAAALASLATVLAAYESIKQANRDLDNANKAMDSYSKSLSANLKSLQDLKKYGTPEQQARATNALNKMSFAKGVTNFQGGLAYVHRGELLVNMPEGTDVIRKSKVNEGGNLGGVTINIGTIQDRADADYILRRIDHNNQLERMGLSPATI